MRQILELAVALPTVLLLTACGGGGDSATQPEPAQAALSLQVTGAGRVDTVPEGAFSCTGACRIEFLKGGDVLTLRATPSAGQSFSGWTGACSGTAPTCSFPLSQDAQIGVKFVPAT